jgi:hypothetical protein
MKMTVYTRFGDPVVIGQYGIQCREAMMRIRDGVSTHAEELDLFKVDPVEYAKKKEILKSRGEAVRTVKFAARNNLIHGDSDE